MPYSHATSSSWRELRSGFGSCMCFLIWHMHCFPRACYKQLLEGSTMAGTEDNFGAKGGGGSGGGGGQYVGGGGGGGGGPGGGGGGQRGRGGGGGGGGVGGGGGGVRGLRAGWWG